MNAGSSNTSKTSAHNHEQSSSTAVDLQSPTPALVPHENGTNTQASLTPPQGSNTPEVKILCVPFLFRRSPISLAFQLISHPIDRVMGATGTGKSTVCHFFPCSRESLPDISTVCTVHQPRQWVQPWRQRRTRLLHEHCANGRGLRTRRPSRCFDRYTRVQRYHTKRYGNASDNRCLPGGFVSNTHTPLHLQHLTQTFLSPLFWLPPTGTGKATPSPVSSTFTGSRTSE